ncbi:MAG: DUF5916 domain-containing protein, partial [bacterium]
MLLFIAGFCLAQEDSVRVLVSVPTQSPVVDGVLEEAWNAAPTSSGFTQWNPDAGVPSREETTIRCMHSTSALYVFVFCYDSEPEKIQSALSKRDRLYASDKIYIGFDPYHDHRTGFYFGANPHGVMEDGIFFNDNHSETNWDGYWKVATAITDSGWAAEFQIPFSTLRFLSSDSVQTWGFNVARYILRYREESAWQEVSRDQDVQISRFGHLTGLSDIHPGQGLEFRPSFTGDFIEKGQEPIRSDLSYENLGLDLKYRPIPNLTVDATLNPDFAQIEADDEVINLSEYPVYLTEKRPFFLEGAGLFDTYWELFYSRRITNPDVGLKITSRYKDFRMMALGARNRNEDDLTEDFAIFRLKKDFLSESELGLLITAKEGPEADWARVWSFDSRLRAGDNWVLTSQLAQSYKPNVNKENWAYRLALDYQSDLYSGNLWGEAMMPQFDANDAGWISYNDVKRTGGWLQWAPRPEKWGIRLIRNNVNFGAEKQ